jgi:hypothetical protein
MRWLKAVNQRYVGRNAPASSLLPNDSLQSSSEVASVIVEGVKAEVAGKGVGANDNEAAGIEVLLPRGRLCRKGLMGRAKSVASSFSPSASCAVGVAEEDC